MMPREALAEIAAMELLETALDLPVAERAAFIAGIARPLRIRQLALRLLPLADEPDNHFAPADIPPMDAVWTSLRSFG